MTDERINPYAAPQVDGGPAVARRRILMPAVYWGAIAFVVTFSAFWYLDSHGILRRASRILPDAGIGSYHVATALLLGFVPLLFALMAGLFHRSWRIGVVALLVYAIPVGLFFLAIMPVFW